MGRKQNKINVLGTPVASSNSQDPLFELGKIVATHAALELLGNEGVSTVTLLTRHQQGDFGFVDEEDKVANLDAIACGSRVLSSYQVGDGEDKRVWIITDAVGDDGRRFSTCLLLPSEY